MAPKRKAKLVQATGPGPALPEPTAVTESSTTKSGKVTDKVLSWKPNTRQPVVMGRNLKVVGGARASRRPSKTARRAGKRSITEVEWADEYDPPSDWEDKERMPEEEKYEADFHWAAGPQSSVSFLSAMAESLALLIRR